MAILNEYQMEKLRVRLAERHEGDVFLNRFFSQSIQCDEFSLHEIYYVIKNGIAYHIDRDQSLKNTKDDLIEIACSCVRVGKYDKNKKYKEAVKHFTMKEFNKKMRLKNVIKYW